MTAESMPGEYCVNQPVRYPPRHRRAAVLFCYGAMNAGTRLHPRASKASVKAPCDEAAASRTGETTPCAESARPWVLTATILASSMAFIDSTVVNVALPALQSSFHATVVDVQWVVEAYGLFLAALILVGGSLGDLFRTQAHLRQRSWDFCTGLAGLRHGCVGAAVDPAAQRTRRGSGVAGAGQPCHHQHCLRRATSRRRHRYLVGLYRHHHRDWPGPRRMAGGPRQLALGVLHQPATGRGRHRHFAVANS